MRRQKTTIWATAATLSAMLLGGAGVAAPGSAATGAPAWKSPVRLEMRLKAGDSHRFRVTDETALVATLPGGGVRRSDTVISSTFALLVERVNADGSYAVRLRPDTQTVTVNGRDAAAEAPQGEATATLARDGRISGISGPEKKPGSPAVGFTARDLLQTLFDENAAYPTQPLGIGEGWKDKVDSPLDKRGGRITVNNTLLALDVLDGVPVARVFNVVAEPLQIPPDEDGVAMSGMLEGGGLATVDLNTGLPREGRDTVRLKFSVNAPAPTGDGKMNVDTEAGIKFRIQALPSGSE